MSDLNNKQYIDLISKTHNISVSDAETIFNLVVKENCQDIDFYDEFISDDMTVFDDKKELSEWISNNDFVLAEALEETFLDNGIEVNSNDESFANRLVEEYIKENNNILEISDSMYVVWAD